MEYEKEIKSCQHDRALLSYVYGRVFRLQDKRVCGKKE